MATTVYALSCGSLEFDRSLFFPGDAPGRRMLAPVGSYLVVHPRGKLVFDTGVHCDARTDAAGRLGKRVASLFTLRVAADEDPVGQLAKLGLKPDDIDFVANSHFHFDHCGCNGFFPKARFLVQKAELAAARANPQRYNPKDWDLPLEYRELDGEHDVFGDGSVVLLPTPGHTPGHQSLRVRSPGAPDLVLASDACYTLEHMEQSIVPANAHDPAEMLRSMRVLQGMKDRQGAVLVYGHDAAQWASLPAAPAPIL